MVLLAEMYNFVRIIKSLVQNCMFVKGLLYVGRYMIYSSLENYVHAFLYSYDTKLLAAEGGVFNTFFVEICF